MDEDLQALSREELLEEVCRLRQAIRGHRDASGHDLCWHQPELWALLPERVEPRIVVPEWPQFIRGCVHYRQSLDRQLADAPRTVAEFGAVGDDSFAARPEVPQAPAAPG